MLDDVYYHTLKNIQERIGATDQETKEIQNMCDYLDSEGYKINKIDDNKILSNDNKVLLYGIGINRRTSAIRYVFTRLNATVPTGVRDNSTGSHIEPIVTISPNPIANMATIEFDMPQRQYLSVNIYNSLGVEVVRLTENTLTDGKQRLHWMTSGLTSGVYFVRVVMGSTIYSKSVIVGEF
jgi:hypothetical protein